MHAMLQICPVATQIEVPFGAGSVLVADRTLQSALASPNELQLTRSERWSRRNQGTRSVQSQGCHTAAARGPC